jgi:hypothetical protein
MEKAGIKSLWIILLLLITCIVATVMVFIPHKGATTVSPNTMLLPTKGSSTQCRQDEDEVLVSDNKQTTYRNLAISKYPFNKGTYIKIDSPDFIDAKAFVLEPDGTSIIYAFATLRLIKATETKATLCFSETKIKFTDIVTPKTVKDFMPAKKQFDWTYLTVEEKKRWKAYKDQVSGVSYYVPPEWYSGTEVFIPCEHCGGVVSGIAITNEFNKYNLSLEQYYAYRNCADEYKQLMNKQCYFSENSFIISNPPDNLKSSDVLIYGGLLGAGYPSLSLYYKNKNNEIISLGMDGIEDDVASNIISSISFN